MQSNIEKKTNKKFIGLAQEVQSPKTVPPSLREYRKQRTENHQRTNSTEVPNQRQEFPKKDNTSAHHEM